MSKNNIKKFIFYFLIILIVFVLDRVSKIYVINYFENTVETEIYLGKSMFNFAKDYDFLEICITSSAEVIQDEKLNEDIKVVTEKALGEKCKICWKIAEKKCKRHGPCPFNK